MAEDNATTAVTTEPAKGKAKKKSAKKKSAKKKARGATKFGPMVFPKHPILKCLRIPQAVLENNAGKECSDREATNFAGLGWSGQIAVEISSALKYGLFERPNPGNVKPTDITRRILKPQKPNDKVEAIREGVLKAPLISDVYKHYRGENLPEDVSFLANTATDKFKIPADRVAEFISVLMEDLEAAQLLEDLSGKKRVLDITHTPSEAAGVFFHHDRRSSEEGEQGHLGCSGRFLFRDHALCSSNRWILRTDIRTCHQENWPHSGSSRH